MSKIVARRLLAFVLVASLAACGKAPPPGYAPACALAAPKASELASQPHPVPSDPQPFVA